MDEHFFPARAGHFGASMLRHLRPERDNYGQRSYAQCGEDMIVRFLFGLLGQSTPSYLDIGANHPYSLSNTAHFYVGGSRGVTVEPDPTMHALLVKARPHDVHLNVGVAGTHGELTLYLMEPNGVTTFSAEHAALVESQGAAHVVEQRTVPVVTVPEIVRDHCGEVFPDFLSLDAETLDFEILQSIDFTRPSLPTVICVESVSFDVQARWERLTDLVEFVQAQGYLLYADTHINSIFVRQSVWGR